MATLGQNFLANLPHITSLFPTYSYVLNKRAINVQNRRAVWILAMLAL